MTKEKTEIESSGTPMDALRKGRGSQEGGTKQRDKKERENKKYKRSPKKKIQITKP